MEDRRRWAPGRGGRRSVIVVHHLSILDSDSNDSSATAAAYSTPISCVDIVRSREPRDTGAADPRLRLAAVLLATLLVVLASSLELLDADVLCPLDAFIAGSCCHHERWTYTRGGSRREESRVHPRK